MASKIDHSRFIKLLSARFPEVEADVDSCSRGLLHLEVGTLLIWTQQAIDAGERDRVKAYFAFVDEIYRDATPDVENAIDVSFLEHLHFGDRNKSRAAARNLLSPRLTQALSEIEAFWEEISRKSPGKAGG